VIGSSGSWTRSDPDGPWVQSSSGTPPRVERVQLTVTDPGCGLLNVNANRRKGHHQQARDVKEWREQTHAAYMHQWQQPGIAPFWDACDAVAYVGYPDKRVHDPGNDYPTAKAIVDELVDLGFLPDDDWTRCTGPDMRYDGVVSNPFKAAEVRLVFLRRDPLPVR
jgi:hypothetical protein